MQDKKIDISKELKEAWDGFLDIVQLFAVNQKDKNQASVFSDALAKLERALIKSGYGHEKNAHAVFRALAFKRNLGNEYQYHPAEYDALFNYLATQFKGRKSAIALDAIKSSFARKAFQEQTLAQILKDFEKLGQFSDPDEFRELIARNMTVLMDEKNYYSLYIKVFKLFEDNVNFYKAVDRSIFINEADRVDALMRFPELASYARYLQAGVNAVIDREKFPGQILRIPEVQAELAKPENLNMVKRLYERGFGAHLSFIKNLAEYEHQWPPIVERIKKKRRPKKSAVEAALKEKEVQSYHAEVQEQKAQKAKAESFEIPPEYLAELQKINHPLLVEELSGNLSAVESKEKLPSLKVVQEWVNNINTMNAREYRSALMDIEDLGTMNIFKIDPDQLHEMLQELTWRNVIKAFEDAAKKCETAAVNDRVKIDVVQILKPAVEHFMKVLGSDTSNKEKIKALAEKTGMYLDAHAENNQLVKTVFSDVNKDKNQNLCLQTIFTAMEKPSLKNVHGM